MREKRKNKLNVSEYRGKKRKIETVLSYISPVPTESSILHYLDFTSASYINSLNIMKEN